MDSTEVIRTLPVHDAGVAVLNTNVCSAVSLLIWTLLDVLYYKKPAVIGAVQGIITGLVAITPAAGGIDCWAAICMGILSGSIPWVSMNITNKKVPFMRKVDDILGVVHTHLVAGFVGGIFTGIFCNPGWLCGLWVDQSRRSYRWELETSMAATHRCFLHHRPQHCHDLSHPRSTPVSRPIAYVGGSFVDWG